LHVVELGRQLEILVVGGPLNFGFLQVDVAGVFSRNLDLLDYCGPKLERRIGREQLGVGILAGVE
jgi:hypothetical protein